MRLYLKATSKKLIYNITLNTNGNRNRCVLNPGALFFRFVTEAFLLFLAPAGDHKPAGPIF